MHRISREMIGWSEIDGLEHHELLNLSSTNSGSAVDGLTFQRRHPFLSLNERYPERGNQGCRSTLKQVPALNWSDLAAWANAKAGGHQRDRTSEADQRSAEYCSTRFSARSKVSGMNLSNFVSLHPYFRVHPGKLEQFKAGFPAFVEPPSQIAGFGRAREDGERGEESFLWVHRQRR